MTLRIMGGRTKDDKDHFDRTPQANARRPPLGHKESQPVASTCSPSR